MKIATTLLVSAVLCTTLNAEETWMYPIQSPGSSGILRSNDVRIASHSSRIIDVKFATFEDILNWYSNKIGTTAVTDAFIKYKKRPSDAANVHYGSATAHNGNSERTTIVTYTFTPTHNHVTILHPVNDGGVITISLFGTEKETGIQFIRRYSPQSPGS